MKKQQTAVEWLEDICKNRGYHLMEEYFKQAKEMERKQIVDARATAPILEYSLNHQDYADEAKQYYNETYGDERDKKSI